MKKYFTTDEAYAKIKHYCHYQERCHFEVKERLFSMNLPKKEVEILISRLIEENILNEERFAIQFAGGHFRQKKWGRVKISYALKQKRIGETIIRTALKEIEEEAYCTTLLKLLSMKWKSLSGEHKISRETKTIAFLIQKGYEMSIIQKIMVNFIKEETD